ncbi:MAG: LysR family transcriptional regulator [Hyphomicrobiales bacterium]
MDWDKLRIFHAVADAGSFTHAGHELNLSQSAVSRQDQRAEEVPNVALFHRHARGPRSHRTGEMLYRTAHDVFVKLRRRRRD